MRGITIGLVLFGLATAAGAEPRRVALTVTEKGFEPSPVKVKKGEPLELVVTRKTKNTCATAILIPELELRADLPLDQPVTLSFTPAKSGKLKYGCAMYQMVAGVLLVE